MIEGQVIQGDITIQRITDPDILKEIEALRASGTLKVVKPEGELVLGHGENGHSHVLTGTGTAQWLADASFDLAMAELFAATGNIPAEAYVEVVKDTEIVHGEHGPSPVKAGIHVVTRQPQYSYFDNVTFPDPE
jgi:hypothetical protein